MGNITAIDMGIVVLRCAIFDRYNEMFPYHIEKEIKKKNPKKKSYFMTDYSFYSKEHGGTFHFVQFSILNTLEFLESPELNHMLEFYDKHYGVQKEHAKQMLQHIDHKKNIIDFRNSDLFYEFAMKRDYFGMPILSTGGYNPYKTINLQNALILLFLMNDQILRFVSHLFNTEVVKCRELIPFVTIAIDYLNKYTNDCFFRLDGKSSDIINHTGKLNSSKIQKHHFSLGDELYPYLLVNLRSGATFTRVDSKEKHTRLCGTSIGGSFFWGILRLMNYYENPTDAMKGASQGDSSKIDMSVGDIYGSSYGSMGLPANMIASSFGKVKDYGPQQFQDVQKEDVARSLLTMTAVNILIFSSMIVRLHKIKNVVWIGVHVDVLDYMQMCEKAFDILSKEESNLIFPRYHSFLGSLGLLLSQGQLENYGEEVDKYKSEEFSFKMEQL